MNVAPITRYFKDVAHRVIKRMKGLNLISAMVRYLEAFLDTSIARSYVGPTLNLAFFCKLSVGCISFQRPFDRFCTHPFTRFQGGLQDLDQGSLALLDGGRMDA